MCVCACMCGEGGGGIQLLVGRMRSRQYLMNELLRLLCNKYLCISILVFQ